MKIYINSKFREEIVCKDGSLTIINLSDKPLYVGSHSLSSDLKVLGVPVQAAGMLHIPIWCSKTLYIEGQGCRVDYTTPSSDPSQLYSMTWGSFTFDYDGYAENDDSKEWKAACNHKFVNVSLNQIVMECYHCGAPQPKQKD